MKEIAVYRAWGEQMAGMAIGLLHGVGIHARVVPDMTMPIYPVALDGLGEILIVVPEEEAEQAIELLTVRFSEEGVIEEDAEEESGWDGGREPDEEDEKE
ncbi:MAG: hypothetical protein WCU00_06050 [Candidatus Latescibacterota bacterium]